MNYDVDHIDELIGKYLAREAGAEEIRFVELWAEKSEANRKYFDHCKLIFEKTRQTELQEFDADAAWLKLKAKINDSQPGITSLSERKTDSWKIWRVAASIIIILGIGFLGYQLMNPIPPKSYELMAGRETKADTLPDGSGVFLNKGTELAYTFDRQKKYHSVELAGEAYFNIHHEEDKTFIIDAAGVYIRDIGTSFNVRAYPEDSTVEVVVEEGKVMFYTDTDSGVYLSANGKGVYDKITKTFSVEQPEENVLAYKTRFFTFDDTDLRSVVLALNNVYDKKIVLSESLHNCHLTVSFNNENIDEIATIIAETLGLTMKNSINEIRLEGSGCEK